MKFTRLLGEPGTIELQVLRDALHFPAHEDRPYAVANFVASVDGRAAFQGRSGPLSDDGDRALFHALRERVDAVIVGTGTLRTERYGRLIKDEDARRRRTEYGLEPDPLACVVTRSGKLPLDIPLFSEERVVVFAPQAVNGLKTTLIEPAELTLATVLRRLRQDYGVGSLLCEGGPTLFGSLVHEELIDELFLTISPKLVGGGSAPTITRGAELAAPADVQLTSLLERDGSLFLRLSFARIPRAAE
jgi:riboflavin biosynthesis pyrimidine reductase